MNDLQVNGLSNNVVSIEGLASNLEAKKQIAKYYFESGYYGNVKTPAQAMTILFKSIELSIPYSQALENMYIVSGKLTMQGNLMLALIQRSGLLESMTIDEQEESCTVTMKRNEPAIEYTSTFSMQDAIKAGLTGKDNWKKYKANMLKWRAMSICARTVFADVIQGMYVPEDMINDANVIEYDSDGNVTIIDAPVKKEVSLQDALDATLQKMNTAKEKQLITDVQILDLLMDNFNVKSYYDLDINQLRDFYQMLPVIEKE